VLDDTTRIRVHGTSPGGLASGTLFVFFSCILIVSDQLQHHTLSHWWLPSQTLQYLIFDILLVRSVTSAFISLPLRLCLVFYNVGILSSLYKRNQEILLKKQSKYLSREGDLEPSTGTSINVVHLDIRERVIARPFVTVSK
jgi:hypothetical protein